MRFPIVTAAVVWLSLLGGAAAQPQEGLLDVMMVKFKPEKRTELYAAAKKMADANRQQKGDAWLGSEVMYGESGTVSFLSLRTSYADVESGMGKFMASLTKGYGPAGSAKLLQDFDACVLSARTELRRRRTDLSANAPRDPAALFKLVGEARFVRTTAVRVRPGRGPEYERLLLRLKAAAERTMPGPVLLVSQAVAGTNGTYYYVSSLQDSLAGFDAVPTLPQLLGTEYANYARSGADLILGTETWISRYVPELSNPPEEIAAVAPDFWRPKPAAPAKPKPKAAAPKTQ